VTGELAVVFGDEACCCISEIDVVGELAVVLGEKG
jgi:hypothetical protein